MFYLHYHYDGNESYNNRSTLMFFNTENECVEEMLKQQKGFTQGVDRENNTRRYYNIGKVLVGNSSSLYSDFREFGYSFK